jgi:hypothetical protein
MLLKFSLREAFAKREEADRTRRSVVECVVFLDLVQTRVGWKYVVANVANASVVPIEVDVS